jgi:tetratricopeptide (TPR) repeat protein
VKDDKLRSVDAVGDEERRALTQLRFFFVVLPISFCLLVLVPVMMTDQQVVVQALALLIVSPLLLLVLGYECVEIGRLFAMRGHYAITESLYKVAIILMSVFRIGPIRNFHAFPTALMAELLLLTGKSKEAENYYCDISRLCHGARDGSDAFHSQYLVAALKDLGICRYRARDYDGALTTLKKALLISLKECFPDDTATIGMPAEDENVSEERIVLFANLVAKELKPDNVDSLIHARTLLYLGATLRATGSVQAAHNVMIGAMKYLEERYPSGDAELFSPYMEFAQLLKDRGDSDDAEAYFAKAKETAYTKFNRRHPNLLLVKALRH